MENPEKTKNVVDASAAPAKAVKEPKAPKAVKEPKAPQAPKEPKPAKEPRVKLASQNGISRPADPTKGTGLVWVISDKVSSEKGSPAARKEVMDIATVAPHNINAATVATQYGKWRTFNGLAGQPAIRTAKPVSVDENGVPSTPAAAAAAATTAAAVSTQEAVAAQATLR